MFQQSQFYTDGYFLLFAFFKLEFLMCRAVIGKNNYIPAAGKLGQLKYSP